MGDRANVLAKENDDDPGVYLYTHWAGTELPHTLQKALAKKWRWDDTAYLARIIFDTMTEGQQGNETGYGISTFACDGNDRILEVNCTHLDVKHNGRTWTFEEYIKLSEAEVSRVWYNE